MTTTARHTMYRLSHNGNVLAQNAYIWECFEAYAEHAGIEMQDMDDAEMEKTLTLLPAPYAFTTMREHLKATEAVLPLDDLRAMGLFGRISATMSDDGTLVNDPQMVSGDMLFAVRIEEETMDGKSYHFILWATAISEDVEMSITSTIPADALSAFVDSGIRVYRSRVISDGISFDDGIDSAM